MTLRKPEDENSTEDSSQDAMRALEESKRRYLTLFETMAQGVVWQDNTGRVTSANPAAERILGFTEAQLKARSPALDRANFPLRDDGSLYTYEDRPTIKALYTGQPVLGAILGFPHLKLGELRWIRVDAIPEIDPNGGPPLGVYTVFEDITDRRRARMEAAETARKAVTILENVTDAFFALDKDWRYTFVNGRGVEMAGRAAQELIGRCIWDIYPDLVGTVFEAQYQSVMNGGAPVTFEAYYAASQVWYRVHAYGTGDGVAFYLRDVTAERRTREDSIAAARRQREFMRDVLFSVTNGKLILCLEERDLPGPRPECPGILLTQTEGLRGLRRAAEEAARAEGFIDDRCFDLVTAVSEAGMNAVVHAGGGVAFVRTLPSQIVQTWIIDEGPGISFENLPRAALEKGFTTAGTLGHGMKMMLRSTDRIFLRTTPTGAVVVLEQGPHAEPSLLLNEW
ncbi:hypothetical protein CCAX7_55740 [Capsulimonas corticalis]|uniref:Uncharacterized protein n=1 Tax=Capsulimonas corticalis TaxID=2219043 RepID=A0A402D0Q3_9BACT|nr:PAS domain-containing protein [Capsulimonas corticalis]BDI33523.1 hypothetical protein CCAX7_55740 [Capsulimonas corticalis]